MPGIGHKLPLPLHVFCDGTNGPAGERDDQRKHQKPADRAEKQRQKGNAHDRISAGTAVQKDNAVSAFRARENLISIGSGRSARPAHIKAEGQAGGFLFRDGSNMADVRADYMTLAIQIRNKVQGGHAHVIVHRFIKETVPPSAVCSAWLVKDPLHAEVRITDREIPGARPITTGYETLESGPVSRLRVHLITGRTHQIRAHLAALGHPVLGDDLYGDRSFNRREKARTLKLCAVSLKLETEGRLPHLDGREFTITPPF